MILLQVRPTRFPHHRGHLDVVDRGYRNVTRNIQLAVIDGNRRVRLVDGATSWQTFQNTIFPVIRPIMIPVAVLSFIASHRDFVIARVLLKSADKLTDMVGLNLFQTIRFDVDFGMLTAGAVIAAIPILLMYFPLQRYVISGLVSGAYKG